MGIVTEIPIMQIRPDCLLVYGRKEYEYRTDVPLIKNERFKSTRIKKNVGELNEQTKRRLSKGVSLLVLASEKRMIDNPITKRKCSHRLAFISLTIPSIEKRPNAKICYKKLLRPFLQWMEKTKKVDNYVWKIELQKRGQIHYHITTTAWILHSEIRNKWNYLLSKNSMMDEYQKKYKNSDPNSTDVHEVRTKKQLSIYLRKELGKTLQNEENVNSKVFGCTKNISEMKYFTTEMNSENEKRLLRLDDKNKIESYKCDYCDVLQLPSYKQLRLLTKEQQLEFHNYHQHIRGLLYHLTPCPDPVKLFSQTTIL